MKNSVQKWPEIPFKLGRLVMIIHWPDQVPMLTVKYKTASRRDTYFSTMVMCRKIVGPFYWVKEFHMEVKKGSLR